MASDVRTLTAQDRCDSCNAQAMVVWIHKNESKLLFCAHHSCEFGIQLELQGFFIAYDISVSLTAKG